MERLDEELRRHALRRASTRLRRARVLTAIEAQGEQTTSTRPEFETLRDTLRAALAEPDDKPAL